VAVKEGHEPITQFEQWYTDYQTEGTRTGGLEFRAIKPCGDRHYRGYMDAKREMDARVQNYWKLEALADADVISPKDDLPNVSSGETAGLIRRTARNLVQNAPNVEVISNFDDDDPLGIFAKHILMTKIIGSDHYSNDMQQNLFASTKTSLTLGFDCVIPVLLRDHSKGWYIKYDPIQYRDVFPEPGAKDVRDSDEVYIRRYLTKGDVHALIRDKAPGWDVHALKLLCEQRPPARDHNSASYQDKKHKTIPDGYEIITWYSHSGDPFLTFDARTKLLLRIEKNKHPQKQHPVHFLILEKDSQQPLGKSQVELLMGRQDFQDLMLNGAMKLWYRNINPSILGFGAANAIPNLSPGKYTQISNPNAKIEPFEVNTGTLMQYGQISQQNMGSMVNLLGTGDQAMAAGEGGMGATPQGVEAQDKLVDITTNNYQKAIEGFVSHYCSYALTIYFAELQAASTVSPTAEARLSMLKRGMKPELFNEKDGTLELDFSKLATEYFVRCIPGSLTELADEKQLRVLNELFIPLSQALPAMAGAQDPTILRQAVVAMQYIIQKQIELSGADDAENIKALWNGGQEDEVKAREERVAALEARISDPTLEEERQASTEMLLSLQQQVSTQGEVLQEILRGIGGQNETPAVEEGSAQQDVSPQGRSPRNVPLASA
jgi:hypothetical protein